MKFIVAISAFVAAVAAQDINSIPECGRMCINNMVGIANTQFGCANGDVRCYCNNPAFARGLSDCSIQACGAAVQGQVVAYGTAYCANAGSGGSSSGSASGSTTASPTTSSSALSSASSVASSASSRVSSAASSASNAVSSVASSAASAASSAASAATGSSSGNGAMRTAAPLAGAGALGLAMLFV